MRNLPDEFVQSLLDELDETGQAHAKAKARMLSLTEKRKMTKARLMRTAEDMGIQSGAKQEAYAYVSPIYSEVVNQLALAVEDEDRLANRLRFLEIQYEAWRTVNANLRDRR